MNIEIVENKSYYAWSVYVDDDYVGMVFREPNGRYVCPRTGIDSNPNHFTFPTVMAAAQYLADLMVAA